MCLLAGRSSLSWDLMRWAHFWITISCVPVVVVVGLQLLLQLACKTVVNASKPI